MGKRRKIQKLRNLEIRGPSACALRGSGVTCPPMRCAATAWLTNCGLRNLPHIWGPTFCQMRIKIIFWKAHYGYPCARETNYPIQVDIWVANLARYGNRASPAKALSEHGPGIWIPMDSRKPKPKRPLLTFLNLCVASWAFWDLAEIGWFHELFSFIPTCEKLIRSGMSREISFFSWVIQCLDSHVIWNRDIKWKAISQSNLSVK